MNGKTVIGVSGGHTESSVCLFSEEPSRAVCATGDSLNLHTFPYQTVVNRLDILLDKLADRAGQSLEDIQARVDEFVLALPGAAYDEDQELARLCLHRSTWTPVRKCRIVDDTWAGLVGGTLQTKGICAFAGTGASIYVGFGEWKAKPNKIDGWGPVLGDFGSGFQLVVDFFRRLGRRYDEGKIMPLFEELGSRMEISDIDEVQRWFDARYIVYPNDWRIRFANLAFIVTEAADRTPNPDLDAVDLVRESAMQMVESIKIATQRFPDSVKLPLVFQGGMFEYSSLYRNTVEQEVGQFMKGPIGMAKYRPVVGAFLMALMKGRLRVGGTIRRSIAKAIEDLPQEDRKVLVVRAE
jgi:N-acetylglucosamine kinase-like BadF-type ATPase